MGLRDRRCARLGRVTVHRTRVSGMSAHITLHASHALMLRNAEVIDETLCFLRTGAFVRPGSG